MHDSHPPVLPSASAAPTPDDMRPSFLLRLGMNPGSDPEPDGTEISRELPALEGDAFWAAFHPDPGASDYHQHLGTTAEEAARQARQGRAELERIAASACGGTLVIRRRLADPCKLQVLSRLARFLTPRFRSVKVEILLDPPEQQMTKEFVRRLEDPAGDWRLRSAMPPYRKLYRRFEKAFGRQAVDYRMTGGGSPDFIRPPADAIAMLFALRTYCWFHSVDPLTPDADPELFEALRSMGGTDFGFAQAAVDEGLRYRAKDIKWLEKRLGSSVPAGGWMDGFGSAEDLLRRSVEAALRFPPLNPTKEKSTDPMPRTAREVAHWLLARSARARPRTQPALDGRLVQADRLAAEPGPACFIHIGMPKTGTTSIQAALSSSRAATDFEYLGIRPANHSRLIFGAFSKSPESLPYYRKLGLGTSEMDAIRSSSLARLRRELERNQSRKLVISGETIFQLREDELRDMAAFFQATSTKLRIVAYLRPVKSFMESVFQQRLKRGVAITRFEAVYPDYAERIAAFDAVFGTEQVILRKFDHSLFPEGDVVIDFCQVAGIALSGYAPSRLNETMGTEAIALLYAFHHFGGSTGTGEESMRVAAELVALLQSLEGSRFSLARSVVERVAKAHQADLAWIERRAGFPLSSALEPDRPGAIRSLSELLAHSMAGARMLIEAVGGDPSGSKSPPATPFEAAVCVKDLIIRMQPDLDIRLRDAEVD